MVLCALCSVSRLFWSTVDPRRRSVYTCRIVEVVPKVVASLPVVIEDMTISHDVNDPNYDPVRAAVYCSRTRLKSADEDTVSVSEDECLSDTGSADELTDLTSSDPDLSKYDCIRTNDISSASLVLPPSQLWARPAFSQSTGLHFDHSLPSGVRPWNEQNARSSPSLNKSGISNNSRKVRPAVNDNDCSVSGLSQDTLKLLGISSASHNVTKSCQRAAVITEPLTAGGDDLLLSMACRLNEAAARSGRTGTRLRKTGVTDQKAGSGDGGQQSSGHLQIRIGNESCQPSRTFVYKSDERCDSPSRDVASWSKGCITEPDCGMSTEGLTSVMQTDGPPYLADSDLESDNLHLVADFSTDEENSSDELDEEQLRSKLVTASLREDAEMCSSSTSCMNEKSIIDCSEKVQEKPHVVLHDILKAGIPIQDGICHLNFEGGKALKNCVLMRKSPSGLDDKLDERETPSIMGYGNVSKSAALMSKVACTPAEKPVVVSQQAAFSVGEQSYENDVDKLISDIVSRSSAEPREAKSGNNNVDKLDSDNCVTRRADSHSSQSSFIGPAMSSLMLETSDQKIGCLKITRVSAAEDCLIVPEDAAAARSSVSTVKSSRLSQLMTEPRINLPSSMPLEQMKRSYVRLTSLPQGLCQTQARSSASAQVRQGIRSYQNVRTVTREPVTAGPDSGSLSYIGQVPLNVATLQASVRPVCSSFNSSSAIGTGSQAPEDHSRSAASIETLEHLLANAKQRPYFIRVSTDDAARDHGSSLGDQERSPARPVDDVSCSTGRVAQMMTRTRRRSSVHFAEDGDVATKKMSVNPNRIGYSNHDNYASNINKAGVITSNVLKDASNQPLGPPKRKLRVKLKDRSSLKSGLGLLDFLFWYCHLVITSEVVTAIGRICFGG
jgi:hypothetical protein